MMKKKTLALIIVIGGIFLLGVRHARAGGWAVLTLQSWPGEVTAGKPFTIEYALRQHGNHLVPFDESWMDPTITAVHSESGTKINFEVTETDKAGYYEAEMMLPQPGHWQWTIDAYGEFEMPPLTARQETIMTAKSPVSDSLLSPNTPELVSLILVVAGGLGILAGLFFGFGRKWRLAPVLGLLGVVLCLAGLLLAPTSREETAVAETAVEPAAEMGQILFVSKGCVTCHSHEAVSYSGIQTNMGPNLTSHDATAEFLRLWLRDPSQIRTDTAMPNLELTNDEIASLIAFLQESTAVSQ